MAITTTDSTNRIKVGHTALTWDPEFRNPERLLECIEDVAQAGFLGVEFNGHQVDQLDEKFHGALEERLSQNGIVVASLFQIGDWTDPDLRTDLVADGARWAQRVQNLGGDLVMLVPGERKPDHSYGWSAFETMAQTMNEVGAAARLAGARCAVHPHWGTVVESRIEIDVLLRLLDPSLVGFAPDSGQIVKGGTDPVALVHDWGERIEHVHLKDVSVDWPQMQADGVKLDSAKGYAVLGEGTLDIDSFLDAVSECNPSGWIMAELDLPDRPAREIVNQHADTLRSYIARRKRDWWLHEERAGQ